MSGSGCVLVGAEISSTWTTLPSSICCVCVPRNLGMVFMVESGDVPKGLKADDKGKG